MIDKKKVRIMTALAIYDKYQGQEDRKAEEYYMHDYIYRKNFWTRINVIVGFCILVGFYGMHMIYTNKINAAIFDFMDIAKRLIIILVIVLIIYSIIGAIIYAKQYKEAKERLESYYALLDKLHEIENTNK